MSLFMYIISMLLLSFSGIFANQISLPSDQVVVLKCAIAFLFTVIVFLFGRKKFQFHKYPVKFIYLVISAVFMGLTWIYVYKAYRLMGVGGATIFNYVAPIALMLAAPFLFNEKMPSVIGFLCMVGGFGILAYMTFTKALSQEALLSGVMCAVFYSLMVIFYKKTGGIPGLEKCFWQALVSLLTVVVVYGVENGFSGILELPTRLGEGDVVPMLLLGVVASGIGNCMYFVSMDGLSVQKISALAYLNPLFAIVISYFLGGGLPTPLYLGGCVLVLIGVVIFCFAKPKKRKK